MKAKFNLTELKENEKVRRFLEKTKGLVCRRNFVIMGSLVFIAGAVWLNWYLFAEPTDDISPSSNIENIGDGHGDIGEILYTDGDVGGDTADEDSYFTSTQLNRQRARDEAMEVLQLVLTSDDALQDAKDEAAVGIAKIASDIEREANIESLITAKGFEDCVAVLGSESASIIVRSEGLMQNEISQIKEIVYEAAGIMPDKIKIIEKQQ